MKTKDVRKLLAILMTKNLCFHHIEGASSSVRNRCVEVSGESTCENMEVFKFRHTTGNASFFLFFFFFLIWGYLILICLVDSVFWGQGL